MVSTMNFRIGLLTTKVEGRRMKENQKFVSSYAEPYRDIASGSRQRKQAGCTWSFYLGGIVTQEAGKQVVVSNRAFKLDAS